MTEHVKDELLDLIEGELSAKRRGEVLDHLASCPECARERERLEQTLALFSRLPDPEPPADLNRGIVARAQKVRQQKVWWKRMFVPPLAAAALAVIAVSVATLVTKEKTHEKLAPEPAPALAMKEKAAPPRLDLLAPELLESAAPPGLDPEAGEGLGELAPAPALPEPEEDPEVEEPPEVAMADESPGATVSPVEAVEDHDLVETDEVLAWMLLDEPSAPPDPDLPVEVALADPAPPPPPAAARTDAAVAEEPAAWDETRSKSLPAPKVELDEPAPTRPADPAPPATMAPAVEDEVHEERTRGRASPGRVLLRAELTRAGRGCDAALPLFLEALELLGYDDEAGESGPAQCGRSLDRAVAGTAECRREAGDEESALELEAWHRQSCPLR